MEFGSGFSDTPPKPEPVEQLDPRKQFKTEALCRITGLSNPFITNKHQLRIQVEQPEGSRELDTVELAGTESDLIPYSARQWIDAWTVTTARASLL